MKAENKEKKQAVAEPKIKQIGIEQIRAVPSLVLKGKKQDIVALFIAIKRINKEEKERLLKIIAESIYLHKGILSQSKEDSVLVLFNLQVKQLRPELEAIAAAIAIIKKAKEFQSLILGIGINNGRAIVSGIKDEILNYTCLGNAIDLAKKLAEKSVGEILISKTVYDKAESKIKAKQSAQLTRDFAMPVYIIAKISEREKFESYIKQFVDRMKEEGK